MCVGCFYENGNIYYKDPVNTGSTYKDTLDTGDNTPNNKD
jgi:hypothetical protein